MMNERLTGPARLAPGNDRERARASAHEHGASIALGRLGLRLPGFPRALGALAWSQGQRPG
jgi:hypothetical protein